MVQSKQNVSLINSPTMCSKKKSMPEAVNVKNSKQYLRKDYQNSKSLTKQQFNGNKQQSQDLNLTPKIKLPSTRVQSPIPISVQQQQQQQIIGQSSNLSNNLHATIHSPLDLQESTHIKVYTRFRPTSKLENELTRNGLGQECALYPDDYTVVLQPDNLIYTFDRSFGLNSTQESVYKIVGSSTIDDVLNGYNGTIFAYGQTGSGKTYTMFGKLRDNDLKGIIPRSIEEIFDYISRSDNEIDFILTCSMLEIYKETLYDLLSINRPDLKIKECPNRGIYVENLTQISQEELLKIVELGEQTRKVATTRINQYSSRSHTIFMLELRQKYSNDTEKRGKLNLVDLAGSEKVGKTGAMGEILEEAKKINLSLSCLGNVIHAITTGNEHIPYRNSKVTRVLQESLGGNYKTSLIVTCSSHSSSLEETISTLKFASRAKSIKNHFKVNMKVPHEVQQQIIVQLRQELFKVSQELEQIKRRSILDIPSEDIQYSNDIQQKYNSRQLSNNEKHCFKSNNIQNISSSDVAIDNNNNNISNIVAASDTKSILKTNPHNLSQQVSNTIDLSFFSQKKGSSADVDMKGLIDQLAISKEREIQFIRQLDDLRQQNQNLKVEHHKKDMKLLHLSQKVNHLEKALAHNKENGSFGCGSFIFQKDSRDVLRSLSNSLKSNSQNLQTDIQQNVKLLDEKLSQYDIQLSQQNELNMMLVSENNYLNKQLELLHQQFEQDRYFQGLLREKIESMNLEYFRKVDHLLNGEMSNSRVFKIISKQKSQTEEIVKKLSKNNFATLVYRVIAKELQDVLKNLNPETVQKALKLIYDSLVGSQLDSAFVDLFSQYDSSKIKSSENRQHNELLIHENKRLNDRLVVLEEQLLQSTIKNEKLSEVLTVKNQVHRQKLLIHIDNIGKSNFYQLGEKQVQSVQHTQKNAQRQTLFRFDYGLE